ncbi:hypothetical protein [Rufibacter soli]
MVKVGQELILEEVPDGLKIQLDSYPHESMEGTEHKHGDIDRVQHPRVKRSGRRVQKSEQVGHQRPKQKRPDYEPEFIPSFKEGEYRVHI